MSSASSSRSETQSLLRTSNNDVVTSSSSSSCIYSIVFGNKQPPCPVLSNEAYFKLSALEKFKLYGIFPWKSLVQLLTLVVFFTQVIESHDAYYPHDIRTALQNSIYSNTELKLSNGFTNVHHKYVSSSSFISDLESVIQNYFDLPPGVMGMRVKIAQHPTLIVTRMSSSSSTALDDYYYYPTRKNLFGGLLTSSNPKDICLDLTSAVLQMSLQTSSSKFNSSWSFTLTYKYSDTRSTLVVRSAHHLESFSSSNTSNVRRNNNNTRSISSLDTISIILTFTNILLILKSLCIRPVRLAQQYAVENQYFANRPVVQKVLFTIRLSTLKDNKFCWKLWILGANVATMIYSIVKVYNDDNVNIVYRLMEVAAFFNACIVPSFYYQLFVLEHYKTIYETISIAIPQISRVALCLLPIMLAYVFVGTLLFSEISPRFASFSDTWITLFSVANGDDIRATIRSMHHSDSSILGFAGAMYIISYMIIFIYFVLTIIISVMEKTYQDVSSNYLRRVGGRRRSSTTTTTNRSMNEMDLHSFMHESSMISSPFNNR